MISRRIGFPLLVIVLIIIYAVCFAIITANGGHSTGFYYGY